MLKLENIQVIYNKSKILQGITAHLNEGDFVVIIGPNGAGKTTLLHTIVGSVTPSAGTLWLNNNNITANSALQRSSFISRIYQDPLQGTISDMTIEENLAVACYKGVSAGFKNAFKKLRSLADAHDILKNNQNLLQKKMNELSGGQRQRIAFLMATLYPCKILLLDEPTAALDPKSSEMMLHTIETFAQTHKTITMLITHNLDDALRLGNKLWIINEGKLIKEINEDEKKKLSAQELKKIVFG